ncbi:usg protein [Consotaella aegiceratis]|uniref:usg protein n=1 Tax=Consotaella aegiceratis TaxID=3097961 RepID=UPI002F422AD4
MPHVPDIQFERMLSGFGLTTAEVLYRMPDHPGLLQSFSWQFEDLAPDYPRLKRFLDHWEREIEAAIHSVRVMHHRLITPREVRMVRDGGLMQ